LTATVAPGASKIEIVIIISVGADAAEYNARRDEVGRMRPERCPGCDGTHIIGHGWYRRWEVWATGQQELLSGIKRWLCKGCRKTISLLPDFLHHHRHYRLAAIEDVLRGRIEQDIPVNTLTPREVGGPGPAPSDRSVRRWEAAFRMQALRWLSGVLTMLARVMPTLASLDPHGGGAARTDPALTLLMRCHELARWLAVSSGVVNSLRTLWRWGWNAGLGRLV
jgi:hypothetical protein